MHLGASYWVGTVSPAIPQHQGRRSGGTLRVYRQTYTITPCCLEHGTCCPGTHLGVCPDNKCCSGMVYRPCQVNKCWPGTPVARARYTGFSVFVHENVSDCWSRAKPQGHKEPQHLSWTRSSFVFASQRPFQGFFRNKKHCSRQIWSLDEKTVENGLSCRKSITSQWTQHWFKFFDQLLELYWLWLLIRSDWSLIVFLSWLNRHCHATPLNFGWSFVIIIHTDQL